MSNGIKWQYIFELVLQNVTTLNLDCLLPTEPINIKLPPVTPAELEVFGEVPSIFLLCIYEGPSKKITKDAGLGI